MWLLLAALALIALSPVAQAAEAVSVAATTQPLASLVSLVGGEYVSVYSIVPPGADPHSYEPGPQELQEALSGADVVVASGPSHTRVEEFLEYLASTGSLNAILVDYRDYEREGLELAEYGGSVNPHGYVWGPRSIGALANAIAKALAAVDPARADYYHARAEMIAETAGSYVGSLEGLRVAIYSPADYYVVAEAGAEVVLILASEPSAEPDPGALRALLSGESGVDVLVVSALDLRLSRAASTIASEYAERGGRVAYIPVGDPGYDPLSAIAASVWAVRNALASGPGQPAGTGEGLGAWDALVAGLLGFTLGVGVTVAWARRASG